MKKEIRDLLTTIDSETMYADNKRQLQNAMASLEASRSILLDCEENECAL